MPDNANIPTERNELENLEKTLDEKQQALRKTKRKNNALLALNCVLCAAFAVICTFSIYRCYGEARIYEKPAQTEIRVCRGTACHSAANAAVVTALEAETGLKMGESNESCSLGWVECLGQCQSAPNLLINGKLYQNVDAGSIPTLLGGEH